MMRLPRLQAGLLLLLILAGLVLPMSAQDSAASPQFGPIPCPVEFPSRYTVECGYVTVPEEHANPNGASIKIAVAVFKSPSKTPLPDPVIVLTGGPGQNALDQARDGLGTYWSTILEQHDLILFDQRGMGYSLPSLTCPETDATKMRARFEADSVNDPLEVDAAGRCLARLTAAGVNIAAYNTVESAADVPVVIAALGYSDYDIWGGSYGSTLGLTVVRNHPEHLRSVTLTSITPPQVDLMAGFPVNVQHNLGLIAEACATNSDCASTYPDIEALFYDAIQNLNEQPATIPFEHPLTRQPASIFLSGDDLVGAVMYMMYNSDAIGQIPLMLTAINAGVVDGLRSLVTLSLSQAQANTDGALYAMRCMDDVMTTTRADWEAAIQSAAPATRAYWTQTMDWWYAICGLGWGAKQLDPVENTPVTSAIPILLQSGQFDPVTPPAWGNLALETLPNGFHFVYPASGHGAAPTSCAVGMFERFLSDPSAEPDSTCIARLPGLTFAYP